MSRETLQDNADTSLLKKTVAENPFSPPQSKVGHDNFVVGMRLEYQLKYFDVVWFNVVHQFMNPWVQAIFVLSTLLIFKIWLEESAASSAALIASMWYIGGWIVQFIFSALIQIARENRTQFTQRTVEISDEYFF